MAQYLTLPDGNYIKVPDGMAYEEALAKAQQKFPEAFGIAPPPQRKGLGAAVSKGLESLVSSGRTGYEALTGSPEEAAKRGLERSQSIGDRYAEQVSLEKVKQAYEKNGLLSAAGEALSQVPYALAEQAPNLATTAGAARLGKLLGTPFGTPGKLVGAGLGAGAASLAQMFGSNIERQAAEQEQAGKPVQISRGAAAAAAVPQAALDIASMAIPLGGRMVSKLTGIPEKALLGKSAEQVQKLADEKLYATLAKGLGVGAAAEIPTEVAQQMLERAQAGLSLTSPEALKEYGETAYQVSLLAPLGGAGRLVSRAGARSELRQKQEDEVAAERAKAAEAEEARIKDLQARRGTDEYALEVEQRFKDMLAKRDEYEQISKRRTAEGDLLADQEKREARAAKKALLNSDETKALIKEYNDLKQSGVFTRIAETRAQEAAKEAERKRVEGMSQEDFMLEQLGLTGEKPAPRARGKWRMEESPFAPEPTKTQAQRREQEQADFELGKIAGLRSYAADRIDLAKQQTVMPNAGEYADYLAQDPEQAFALLQQKATLPGLNSKESVDVYRALREHPQVRAALEQRAGQMPQRAEDLKAQLPAKEGKPGFEEEYLSQLDIAETDKQAGRLRAELDEMRRLAGPAPVPGTTAVTQGELFGGDREETLRINQMAGAQRESDLPQRIADAERRLEIALAQRNDAASGRRSQYRETIRQLTEEIRAMREMQNQKQGWRRTEYTKGGEDWQKALVGELPEQQRKQKEAFDARNDALDELQLLQTEKHVGGRDNDAKIADAMKAVAEGIVGEITAARNAALRPETITDITNEVAKIVGDMSGIANTAATRRAVDDRLNALSNKWRAGTQRSTVIGEGGESVTTVPETTTPDMLRQQLERLFANRDKYSATDMGLATRVADNLGAFAANPERMGIASDWLHRLTTTGSASPALTNDLRGTLRELTSAKQAGAPEQRELPARFLPKEIEGKATEATSVAFDTPEEFQKFLTSDAVRMMRVAAGQNKPVFARLHEMRKTFETRMNNVLERSRKQLAELQERRERLEKAKGEEAVAAKQLIADAQARQDALITRLAQELVELQKEHAAAVARAAFSDEVVARISEQIDANVARFKNEDPAFVAATERVKLLKAQAARITESIAATLEKGSPSEGRNIQSLVATREKLIAAIQEQQKVTNRKDMTMLQFLQKDMDLQLQLLEETNAAKQDAQAVLDASKALEDAKSAQQKDKAVMAELAKAAARVDEALGLMPGVYKTQRGIDVELQKLDSDIASVKATLAEGERKLAPKQTKSDFEASLDRVIQQDIAEAFPTKQTQDALLIAWGNQNTEIEQRIARLKAIPGERISFEQRREMLDLVERGRGGKNVADEIDTDLVELDAGVSMLQAKLAADRKEVIELGEQLSKLDPFSIEADQTRTRRDLLVGTIAEREKNLEQFQKRIEKLEKDKLQLQKAYDKAVAATSNDPEVVAAVIKELKAAEKSKLEAIQNNDEAIKTGKNKKGGMLTPSALQKAKVRRNQYMRELANIRAKLSNKLGIERIDVTSGRPVAPGRGARPSQEQKIQMEEAAQREELLRSYHAQMAGLKAMLENVIAKKKSASVIKRWQTSINKLQEKIDEIAPKPMGTVSQLSREQSSAPGKFRTGTQESKATPGVVRQPVGEKRTVKQPTAEKAIADANAFATRVAESRTEKQRKALMLQKSLAERQQIADALDDNVTRLQTRLAALEKERAELAGSQGLANQDRLRQINEEISGRTFKQELLSPETGVIENVARETIGLKTLLANAEKQLQNFNDELDKAAETETENASIDVGDEDTEQYWRPQLISDSIGPALEGDTDIDGKSAAVVMRNVAETTQDPINKAVADRLKMLLGNTNIELVDNLEVDGQAACGAALSDGSTIQLDRKYGMNETTVLHEGVHSATEKIISAPEDTLTAEQRAAKRELEAIYETVKADENFDHPELLTNLSEFAAESLTNPVLRSYMQTKPWALKYMWDAFKSAILRMLGVQMPRNMSEAAIAAVDRLMVKTVRPTHGNTQMPRALPRTVYASTALARAGAVGDKTFAKQRGFMDAIKEEGLGLRLVTNMVDRFAPLERISKYMDSLKGLQMMYYMRMYDQRMNFVAQSVGSGALRRVEKIRPDGRKEYVIESAPGASIKGVVSILKQANRLVGNAEANNRLFSMYLVAKRAESVGLAKLNYSGKITEADLQEVRRAVATTPGLKDIYDKAQREYNMYNRDMLQFAVDTGAISAKTREELIRNGDYVPYYRVNKGAVEMMLGGMTIAQVGSVKDQPYLQELVGGEEPILDFMTSSVQNTNMLVDMSLRNIATKSAVHELRELGMATIGKGSGQAGANVVRYYEHGEERYALVHTEDLVVNGKKYATGIPGELVVKGMEGVPVQNTVITKLLGGPARALRKAVVLNPLYAARQLFRDSLAAPVLSGANFTPIFGALKQVGSAAGKTLEQRGITGGQVFTGTQEDLTQILRGMSADSSAFAQTVSKLESLAMEADALTRRAQYNSYIAQGLSEMEATYMALESMNFHKRGMNPAMHTLSTAIPFFNAQVQSLNVLFKAFSGNMPFNEKLKIREKLYQRGMMIAAFSLTYAAMMQDDETYQNATPDEKYGNWFMPLPGTKEKLRVPIPFEIGYIFKAIPEAIVNSMASEEGGREALDALQHIALMTVPGGTSYGVPQAIKPMLEVGLGKSFYTGRDLETAHEKTLEPGMRSRDKTTAFSRLVGESLNVSPVKIDALIQGYLSTTGLALVDALSFALPSPNVPEPATKKMSELRIVGSLFQPNDAQGIINATYDRMQEASQVKATYQDLIEKGQYDKATRYLEENLQAYAQSGLATQFTTQMRNFAAQERAIKASAKMTADEKREALDSLREQKIAYAKSVREVAGKTARQ